MVASKIFGLETLDAAQYQCQGIAQREHRGRTRAGSQSEPTGFVEFAEFDRDVCCASERIRRRGGNRDQWHAELFECGQQLNDFARLATLRQRQHDVALLHAAQITMKGFRRMQEVSTRACGRKGRGEFLPNEARFAHARDDQIPLQIMQHLNRSREITIELADQLRQGAGLGGEHFATERECFVVRNRKFASAPAQRGSRESHQNVFLDVGE